MTASRALARTGAVLAATALTTLSAVGPASAHVTATPSDATAGAYTVVTLSVGHGCEGSPTTKLEVQVPEAVLSVTPTRDPFYDVETTIVELDEPVTDGHGNEVTERIGSVVYTATTPLPEGQRDTFELSLQVPDAAGELLVFPTIQTCEAGETAWTEVAEEGQDEDELEHPAPSFEIQPASGDDAAPAAADDDSSDSTDSGPSALGWVGVVLGALGLVAGGTALARSRRSA